MRPRIDQLLYLARLDARENDVTATYTTLRSYQ